MIRDRFVLVIFFVTFTLVSHTFAATVNSTKAEAERLVTAATQAEISGNIPESIASLQDAVHTDPGNRLAHWRSGEVRAGEAEAYNLVVAELNTYFVGESGILVHDNTPRRPTRATVPGVVASK